MKKIIFNLTFFLIILCGCENNANTRIVEITTPPKNQLSGSQYQLVFEEYESEDRCNIENYGKSWEDVKYFLKLNGIDFRDGHWLMSPYACSMVKYENIKYMIYLIIDKDSPTRVIYLVNLNNKEIALAKTYRDSGISFYADGKRQFVFDENHFPEARYILDQYINTRTHY